MATISLFTRYVFTSGWIAGGPGEYPVPKAPHQLKHASFRDWLFWFHWEGRRKSRYQRKILSGDVALSCAAACFLAWALPMNLNILLFKPSDLFIWLRYMTGLVIHYPSVIMGISRKWIDRLGPRSFSDMDEGGGTSEQEIK